MQLIGKDNTTVLHSELLEMMIHPGTPSPFEENHIQFSGDHGVR